MCDGTGAEHRRTRWPDDTTDFGGGWTSVAAMVVATLGAHGSGQTGPALQMKLTQIVGNAPSDFNRCETRLLVNSCDIPCPHLSNVR